jgi:hypothetical protein
MDTDERGWESWFNHETHKIDEIREGNAGFRTQNTQKDAELEKENDVRGMFVRGMKMG